jgi:nitric oxide reductase subunit B
LTSDAVLWSALSVAMLLAGLAVVLATFGKFDYLGWKGGPEDNYPQMLAMALQVLGLRHVLTDAQWVVPQKFAKLSFWGLNIGLALMVITNLFPEGILQVWDVLENGYWHARSLEFIGTGRIRMLEWASMPSHLILIIFGVVSMVIAAGLTYLRVLET